MVALTQDPKKNKPKNDRAQKEGAYDRLTPELRQVVDGNVEARAELMLGYKAAIDGAESGKPIIGERLNKLQEKFDDAEKSSFSDDVEKMVYRAAYERTKAESAKDAAAAENGQERSTLATIAGGIGSAGMNVMRFISNTEKVRDDFYDAYEARSKEWDDENKEALRGLNGEALNAALMQQHVKDGKPAKNTDISPDTKDAQGLVKELLAKNDGIAIADVHVFDESYDFVGNNMKQLKEAGVKTIYVEENHEIYKQLYDRLSAEELRTFVKKGYIEKPEEYIDMEITSPDENALNYGVKKSDHFQAAIINMYAAAKENGIKIVGIDEREPPFSDEAMPEWRRIGITNAIWTDNIKNHRAMMHVQGLVTGEDPGKYVVVGGRGHFTIDGKVDELLGIPVVGFTKGAKNSEVAFEKTNTPSDPDFLLPGGVDYIDTKKDLKAEKLGYAGDALIALPMSPAAAVAAKAAGVGLKMYAEKYNEEVMTDMNRVYTPEELSVDKPLTPPATPQTKPKENNKDR